MALLNPAGGLKYHLRAATSRHRWEGFHSHIQKWLWDWKPPEANLVIVGPSGGYSLPMGWLSRFERVICVDVDSSSKWIFRHRLGKEFKNSKAPLLEWIQEDLICKSLGADLIKVVEKYRNSAVLFSNLLGQLKLLVENHDDWMSRLEKISSNLRQLVEGRSFASFHDRVSGTLKPQFMKEDWKEIVIDHRLSLGEIVDQFYAGQEGELVDHCAPCFWEEKKSHLYLPWELTKGRYHLVEGCRTTY